MKGFNEAYLSDTKSYPHAAVKRCIQDIKDPKVRDEGLNRTKHLPSPFCSSRDIYDSVKHGSEELIRETRPLYDGMIDDDSCIKYLRAEDYEGDKNN